LQLDALRAAGCDQVHEDKLSGVAANRPGLTAALAACAAGDVLTVWKLDRLGRSMAELIGIVDDLNRRGHCHVFEVEAVLSGFWADPRSRKSLKSLDLARDALQEEGSISRWCDNASQTACRMMAGGNRWRAYEIDIPRPYHIRGCTGPSVAVTMPGDVQV
jgi:hypothetical protein